MKYHPIPFSEPMVYAVMVGRKTQTRRVPSWLNCEIDGARSRIEFARLDWDSAFCQESGLIGGTGPRIRVTDTETKAVPRLFPIWQPGDRLWVREGISNTFTDWAMYTMDYKQVKTQLSKALRWRWKLKSLPSPLHAQGGLPDHPGGDQSPGRTPTRNQRIGSPGRGVRLRGRVPGALGQAQRRAGLALGGQPAGVGDRVPAVGEKGAGSGPVGAGEKSRCRRGAILRSNFVNGIYVGVIIEIVARAMLERSGFYNWVKAVLIRLLTD